MQRKTMRFMSGILCACILLTGCGQQKMTDQAAVDDVIEDQVDYDGESAASGQKEIVEELTQEESQGSEPDDSSKRQEAESASSDNETGGLDAGRIIEEQSFQVALNEWGDVRFVSYEPDNRNAPLEDVSFYLLKDGEILYQFPDTDEGYGNGLYYQTTFVMFMDCNSDGKRDVVIGVEYCSGAGPQGAIPHTVVRIYEDRGDEFVYREELCSEINSNLPWEDSVTAAEIKEMIITLTSTGGTESNVDNDDVDETGASGYESYSGKWSESGVSHETILADGGAELTCTIRDGNVFSGSMFTVQAIAQRIASVDDIAGTIEDGELFYSYTDDGFGGTGTLHIMFATDKIVIDVLDYQMAEDNRSGYGISGSYEMIRAQE